MARMCSYIEPRQEKIYLRGLRPGRHKPACAATEARQRLEISDIETKCIILGSEQQKR